MSGSADFIRSSSKMAFSDEDILRTLMQSRNRIAAAAWVVVHDAQAAEDIFQNVALKALTKEVRFESAGSVLSWAFITARREGIDWLRRHRNETAGLDTEILDLLEQDWLTVADLERAEAGRTAELADRQRSPREQTGLPPARKAMRFRWPWAVTAAARTRANVYPKEILHVSNELTK